MWAHRVSDALQMPLVRQKVNSAGAALLRSVSFNAGELDDFAPFLSFGRHQVSEFGCGHRHSLAAELGQTGLQFGIGQHCVHGLIKCCDNITGGQPRRA